MPQRIDGAAPVGEAEREMAPKTKVVGTRRRDPDLDPISCHRRVVALLRQADRLSPFYRHRAFV